MGYCSHCHAITPYHKMWCNNHGKKEEVTQQFEVGDKVSVEGTVTTVENHLVEVGIEFNAGGVATRWFRPDKVTLVERPVKFVEGKKYRYPRGEHAYMYLGDNKWYSYFTGKVLTRKVLTSSTFESIDTLIPVD